MFETSEYDLQIQSLNIKMRKTQYDRLYHTILQDIHLILSRNTEVIGVSNVYATPERLTRATFPTDFICRIINKDSIEI